MKSITSSLIPSLVLVLLLAGCAHEPLPTLTYKAATPMGSAAPRVPTSMTFEAGQAVGHALTSYALMPGGFMLPITSAPSPNGAFNTEDQAAFVQNLGRVLTERGVVKLTPPDAGPLAAVSVKFLKTEHFPHMQDYILDALVTARFADNKYERVHHVSTIDSVNLGARMFQKGIDGRRRAAELLLTSVVGDLEKWFAPDGGNVAESTGALYVTRPFESCARDIVDFLRMRYARPSSFWKDGIDVRFGLASESVVVVELRWSKAGSLPPFCAVVVYADGQRTKIVIRERDGFWVSKVGVREAMEEFVRGSRG